MKSWIKSGLFVVSLVTPVLASAASSASFSFSNMYLWRGQNLTPDGPAISGSLDVKNEMGLYAGIWATNEHQGHETDLYGGYGTKLGPVDVDLSYWKYLYPDEGTKVNLGDNDLSEVVLSVGYGPVKATAYIGVESGADSDNYYTLQGSLGKYSLLYGFWDLENPGDVNLNPTGGDEYSHIQFGYQITDKLSFAISKLFSSDTNLANTKEEDPLFQFSYALSFDLDKK